MSVKQIDPAEAVAVFKHMAMRVRAPVIAALVDEMPDVFTKYTASRVEVLVAIGVMLASQTPEDGKDGVLACIREGMENTYQTPYGRKGTLEEAVIEEAMAEVEKGTVN